MTAGESRYRRYQPVCARTELFRQESVGRRVFFDFCGSFLDLVRESCIKGCNLRERRSKLMKLLKPCKLWKLLQFFCKYFNFFETFFLKTLFFYFFFETSFFHFLGGFSFFFRNFSTVETFDTFETLKHLNSFF